MNVLRWPATAVLLVALGTLSACGSDDPSDSADATAGGSTAAASPGAGGNLPGGDPTQLAAIQQCLDAAGLSGAIPSGRPSDAGTPPSGMPTDMPSGMPTDMPTGMPSGGPGGPGGDGPGGVVQDPEVQAALQACGITLPTPSAAPSDQATG